MQKLWPVKTRRFVRLWWLATFKGFFSPFLNRAELFQIIQIPLFLFIIYWGMGEAQVIEELTVLAAGKMAALSAIPIWLALNAIVAPLRVLKQEKDKGRWYGSRFVYHEPELVRTFQIGPEEHGHSFEIKVKDAEPNTLVTFRLTHSGGLGVGQIGMFLPQGVMGGEQITGVRIDDRRRTKLIVEVPKDSVPTTIRIHMLSWEI